MAFSSSIIVGLFPMVADLLHAGHLLALEEAKKHCDYLIVAFNTKPDGKEPIESVYERYCRLKSCKYVNEVIPYAGEKDLELICSTIDYNIRFIGDDHNTWTGKSIEEKREIIPYQIKRSYHNLSSTELKKRIIEKYK